MMSLPTPNRRRRSVSYVELVDSDEAEEGRSGAASGQGPQCDVIGSPPLTLTSTDDREEAVVRRRCLYLAALFEAVLTIFLWLIYETTTKSERSFYEILEEEVLYFNYENSLFDLVVIALVRCCWVTLLADVAIKRDARIFHVGGLATILYMIVKVVIYKHASDYSVSCFALFMVSTFVCVWLQLFLFDVNVLAYLLKSKVGSMERASSERDALLATAPAAAPKRYSVSSNESLQFYSSPGSLVGDLDEDCHAPTRTNLSAEDLALARKGKEVLREALAILRSDGWTTHSDNSPLLTKMHNGIKLFKMEAVLNGGVDAVMAVLFDEYNSQTTWNTSLRQTRILKRVDRCTDVVYAVTVGRGPVHSRDLLMLRHRAIVGPSRVIATASLTHDHLIPPTNQHYVRGESGAGCFVVTPWLEDGDHSAQSKMVWLMNTDLRGWLPNAIVHTAFATSMPLFVRQLNAHLTSRQPPPPTPSSPIHHTLPYR